MQCLSKFLIGSAMVDHTIHRFHYSGILYLLEESGVSAVACKPTLSTLWPS